MSHIKAMVAVVVVAAVCGCSGSDGGTASNTKDSGAGGSSASGGGGGSGGSAADGGVSVGGSAGSGTLGCSADLRDVLDASGTVVQTCAADQGCSNGACIEACAAASASHGFVGCDYLVPTPPAYQTTLPPCFAVALANTWAKPAKISVTRDGATYDVTKFVHVPVNGKPPAQWAIVPASGIPVDEVGVLFLSADPNSIFPENNVPMACPVPTAVGASTLLDGSGTSQAFHIASDTPLSAYDMMPFGGAQSHFPSAELLLPTSAWGKNYVFIATPPGTYAPPGPLWGQILATEADTSIEILPSVDLPAAGSFAATPANQKLTISLGIGEYAQWELAGANDLSGTIVLSDKPIAAFAGNRFYRQQPTSGPGGESTHQQIQAVSALGHEYVGAPFATRRKDGVEEPIRYRFVGVVADTSLSYDPPISGAPTTLKVGQVADVIVTGAFAVKSQDVDHPFAAAQMMDTANVPGGSTPGASEAYCATFGFGPMLGDEEFVVLLPPAQFLSKYVFFTDLTYNTTHLVVTRVKTASGFKEVKVDCLGNITATSFKAVGTSGEYEVAAVDLVRAGQGIGSCLNGRHSAQSEGPFGIVVWGLDCYASYAYPAGGNARTLTTLTVPPTPN